MFEAVRELGLAKAREIAGREAIEDAAVSLTDDALGRPAYRCSFLVNYDQTKVQRGLLRIRLQQDIVDALDRQKDDHTPIIEVLDRHDWNGRVRD